MTVSEGGAVTISRVTEMVRGELAAPGAVRVMDPVCWPTGNPDGLAAIARVALLPVPEAGVTVSQDALAEAVQERVPPPGLDRVTVCVAGAAPFCTVVKARADGLAPRLGGGVRVNATGTVRGEPWAPGAVMVRVPL